MALFYHVIHFLKNYTFFIYHHIQIYLIETNLIQIILEEMIYHNK